jgi:hypothetical protein
MHRCLIKIALFRGTFAAGVLAVGVCLAAKPTSLELPVKPASPPPSPANEEVWW